jgi:hypothetical protein
LIYICIPTWNEQQTVGVVLWKLRQVLTGFPRDYQLLVADDASTDKTPEVLEPYTRVLPLTVIRSDRRLGYAASMEMLFREAVRRSEYPKRDVIVALQADFSDEPDDVVPLIKRLEAGADVAVGNKVSSSRETRTRGMSRSLARFFARRQKWPDGVTPFDGFRAYRLYAVKRAIEERTGRRLLRYEGWAGHAELLRAVLPHARRVDVVNVDDRSDRLQRPRREAPFAAAMQVRALFGSREPQGLVGVEELDRIATTTSRSRERAAVTVQTTQNGRGARSNGSGSRDRRPAEPRRGQGNGRGRAEGRGEAGSARGERPQGRERQRPERERPQRGRPTVEGEATGRAERPKQERPPRQRQERPPRVESQPAPAGAEAVPVDAELEQLRVPGAEGGEVQATEGKAKRRRRRRRKSGARPDAAMTEGTAPEGAAPEGGEDEGGAESRAEAEPGTQDGASAEKKRRRRGGRRGGRGRRKPRPEGTPDAESGGADAGESMPEARGAERAPEGAAQTESD